MALYSDKVMDHFMNPRNVGEIADADGVGEVGNAKCGDIMKMYLKIKDGKIDDVKFETFGCASAIASSSMATELIKGKTIDEALAVTNKQVVDELDGLPAHKLHCSVLAEEAIKSAVKDYYDKNGIESPSARTARAAAAAWCKTMMVSSRGRYALRVMADLAENEKNGAFIPLKEIAEREELSLKYLESIMTTLSKAGLVEGAHGKGGGYRLKRKPEEYRVSEILKLTEGSLAPVSCVEGGCDPCENAGSCRTRAMWTKLDKLINDFFDGITIADLMIK